MGPRAATPTRVVEKPGSRSRATRDASGGAGPPGAGRASLPSPLGPLLGSDGRGPPPSRTPSGWGPSEWSSPLRITCRHGHEEMGRSTGPQHVTHEIGAGRPLASWVVFARRTATESEPSPDRCGRLKQEY